MSVVRSRAGLERPYEIAVILAALAAVVYRLAQWRLDAPDITIVAVIALALVPLAVRSQVTISRGETDLTLGASAAALFSSDLSNTGTILPVWALLVTASYVVFYRDETWGLFRAAIQVLGGAALVRTSQLTDFGLRPYDRVFVGLAAYFVVITLLEVIRQAVQGRGEDESDAPSLLALRWAWVFLVGTGIFYISAVVAVARRLYDDEPVPVVPSLVVALLGAIAVALGVARRNVELTRSLATVVDAAVAMPWRRESIHSSAREWSLRAMRTDDVQVRRHRASGREIGALLDDGAWIVARRAPGDLPFTVIEHQVLDALAHMASASMRRADVEEHLRLLATTDSLSGLSTYSHFREKLEELSALRGEAEAIGVVFIDLDGFKSVNDRFGHFAGDQVIQDVSARLRAHVGDHGLLTRFGGDEFALVVRDVVDEAHLREEANRVLEIVAEPLDLGPDTIRMQASAGTALSVDSGDDMGELVRRADNEMYGRKRRRHDDDLAQIAVEDAVRNAIHGRRLDVAFQPLVDFATHTIRGWEALVRYEDPALGVLSPLTIVDVATRLGMLDQLSMLVAEQSFDAMIEVRKRHGAPALFSINFEIGQLTVWSPLHEYLVRRAEEDDVTVVIELSERDFDRWSPANSAVVKRLTECGMRLAIDDFGTGYSALGALYKAPVHTVKLDKSLLDGWDDERQRIVLRRVVGLLLELDFQVLAEGIEEPEHADLLRECGVQFGQGMWFGAPVGLPDLLDRLALHGTVDVIPRGDRR